MLSWARHPTLPPEPQLRLPECARVPSSSPTQQAGVPLETSSAKEKPPHTTKQENTHFATECWAGTKVNSLGTQIFISREYSKAVNFRFNF